MGDFILDLRPEPKRAALSQAAAFLKFQPHVQITHFSHATFSLILSSVDNPQLWGPYENEHLIVALTGRIALDEAQWQDADKLQGAGGLAAKWIAHQYLSAGVKAITSLNGNFSLVLYDRREEKLFLVTDPAGAFPVFQSIAAGQSVFSSHPDALAIATDETQNWDETSLAEFAFSSLVTPPYTYYRNVRSVAEGTLLTFSLRHNASAQEQSYFKLTFQPQSNQSEADLAEELAFALTRAVTKRALPRLGPTTLALSGGLDSRTILAAVKDRSQLFTFCCFNEENFEFRIAREIADAAGVKLVPIARSFDYYAENAALGVRISGGMGSFANNHFLGVAPHLRELGAENLLTGCYCDYLFKGLVLNRHSRGLLGREELAPYSDKYYFSQYRLRPEPLEAVYQRSAIRFPNEIRTGTDDASVFELEKRRTFPLWHEGDNAQRLVPQRVLHNYLPFADRDLLEVYCKIPYRYKFNRSIFKKAAARICGPALTRISDANTGAPVDATLRREAFSAEMLRVKRKLRRLRPTIATDTSWPDWEHYVPNSVMLRDLWRMPNPAADDFFRRVLLPEDIRKEPADYRGRDLFQVVQLLNLKLWFAQRCSSAW